MDKQIYYYQTLLMGKLLFKSRILFFEIIKDYIFGNMNLKQFSDEFFDLSQIIYESSYLSEFNSSNREQVIVDLKKINNDDQKFLYFCFEKFIDITNEILLLFDYSESSFKTLEHKTKEKLFKVYLNNTMLFFSNLNEENGLKF